MKQYVQEKLRVLIADSDLQIAQVVASSLAAMKIRQTTIVRNGEEALVHITREPVDILITEWGMSPVDGIALVTYLRTHEASPHRALPIIMLTGKGEAADVQAARDAGITEFLIKPFTTKALYHRIEQLVDNPRGFIMAPNYKGPDRRRKEARAEGERRGRKARKVAAQPGVTERSFDEPVMIEPDYVLRRTMSLPAALATVITPQMVAEAQQVINAMQEDSLRWLREDLARLEENIALMLAEPKPLYQEEMEHAALQIKSRAGTFGYMLASNIARLLYLFLTTKYERWKPIHNQAVAKHIEAIKVAITIKLESKDGIGAELLDELQRLVG